MCTQRPGWNKLLPSMQEYLKTLQNKLTRNAYCADLVSLCDWLGDPDPGGRASVNLTEAAIVSITEEDLKSFRDYLLKTGLGPSTANRKLSALRAYYKWLIKQGRAHKNPTTRLKKLEVTKVVQTVEPEVVDSMLEAMKGHSFDKRDRAMLLILADHGLRISQLTGLNVGSIKEEDGRLSLAFREISGRKCVPLSKRAEAALREYFPARDSSSASESPLFLNKLGGRLSARSFRRNLEKRAKAAGLSTVPTPRDLRRTVLAAA